MRHPSDTSDPSVLPAAHPIRVAARRHDLRLRILDLAALGESLDPEDLRRELPAHPTIAVVEYHLSVLRQVGLLP